ncbi:uncharacterized protein LOC113273192 [Papaver somniferum]|uniref:uncharacterized protein LOC113273192 n=1 Tax=Papaver somniferum TaxID=3469 RepID=UPI000E6F6272|nr:uncharacterized protein LOC113273192 [Papaver somniferum]
MLLAFHTPEEQPQHKWYLDTGCNNHMCGRKELFNSLDESVRSIVKFGNNSTIPVMEKGRIGIVLNNGAKTYIMDVFYVPGLHQNLLSMGQLLEKGYSTNIFNDVCSIHDRFRRLITRVQMTKNRLFPLNIRYQKERCYSSCVHNDSWLWRKGMRHMSFNSLQTLAKKEMVSGLPFIELPKSRCENCILGKQQSTKLEDLISNWRLFIVICVVLLK